MELLQLTERILYYPHQEETDRPMLAYIRGTKLSLAIDAGNSADHVNEFYTELNRRGLRLPDFTAITHWHWDHTFGMHEIHGLSIAHSKTNELLAAEKIRFQDSEYLESFRSDDKPFAKEYADSNPVTVVPSDLQFTDSMTLFLGQVTAEIVHAVSPHSEDTALIYIPEEKVLFLGDSTCEDYFNDGYMDFSKLRTLIGFIEKIDCEYCILSHTEPLTKSDLLAYLKTILK